MQVQSVTVWSGEHFEKNSEEPVMEMQLLNGMNYHSIHRFKLTQLYEWCNVYCKKTEQFQIYYFS